MFRQCSDDFSFVVSISHREKSQFILGVLCFGGTHIQIRAGFFIVGDQTLWRVISSEFLCA